MIEFPVTSQASPQPHHASQAAMFSAMLNNLSVDNMTSHTRSLLDCAAQAGNNQARNFGLVSLANNTGDYRQRDGSSVQTDPSSGPLAAMATMTDMKAAAMLSQASNFSSTPRTASTLLSLMWTSWDPQFWMVTTFLWLTVAPHLAHDQSPVVVTRLTPGNTGPGHPGVGHRRAEHSVPHSAGS